MLPVHVNGHVQLNGQVIGHVQYTIYQYSSMSLRISGQNFQVSFVPQIPKDTWLQRDYFKRKILNFLPRLLETSV